MFSACPVCKRIHFRGGLCAHCAGELWVRREPVVRHARGYTVRSLFSWREGQWPGLGWWVRALKHQERPSSWREPAIWCLSEFPPPRRRAVFVPVPSASRRPNHALGFALALSAWSGIPVQRPLALTVAVEQKGLGRAERQFRHFEATQDCSNFTNVILVDDVVTTGATVQAAHRALGSPGQFEAWCLLDRRPCGCAAPLL